MASGDDHGDRRRVSAPDAVGLAVPAVVARDQEEPVLVRELRTRRDRGERVADDAVDEPRVVEVLFSVGIKSRTVSAEVRDVDEINNRVRRIVRRHDLRDGRGVFRVGAGNRRPVDVADRRETEIPHVRVRREFDVALPRVGVERLRSGLRLDKPREPARPFAEVAVGRVAVLEYLRLLGRHAGGDRAVVRRARRTRIVERVRGERAEALVAWTPPAFSQREEVRHRRVLHDVAPHAVHHHHEDLWLEWSPSQNHGRRKRCQRCKCHQSVASHFSCHYLFLWGD